MGENRVRGESILGKLVGEEACCVEDYHLSITRNTAYLNNFILLDITNANLDLPTL